MADQSYASRLVSLAIRHAERVTAMGIAGGSTFRKQIDRGPARLGGRLQSFDAATIGQQQDLDRRTVIYVLGRIIANHHKCDGRIQMWWNFFAA